MNFNYIIQSITISLYYFFLMSEPSKAGTEEKKVDPEFNKNLGEVLEKCNEYIDDETHVYKLCPDKSGEFCEVCKCEHECKCEWLIIMQKTEDTKTNEARSNIVNKHYAKFRASELKVIKIINLAEPNTSVKKEFVINQFIDTGLGIVATSNKTVKTVKYEVGKIVKPDKFDDDINNICSEGIHYFKMPFAAYYYRQLPPNYTGHWIDFYDNGQKFLEIDYINSQPKGPCFKWYSDGKKFSVCNYENGKLSGEYISYYMDGQIQSMGKYTHGVKTGSWTYWHDGKKVECDYINGEPI